MEKADLARAKKKARRGGRTIVFVDESGLSTRPHRVRTWAPRGRTPVLQETFGWEKLSPIAGLTVQRFYFRIYEGSINRERAAEFLRILLQHAPGKLLVIWDGAAIHRSAPVKQMVVTSQGRIWLERLPAYAPGLNPVEYLWAHLKQHEIGNLLVRHGWELSRQANKALRRMRQRPCIIRACWVQAQFYL